MQFIDVVIKHRLLLRELHNRRIPNKTISLNWSLEYVDECWIRPSAICELPASSRSTRSKADSRQSLLEQLALQLQVKRIKLAMREDEVPQRRHEVLLVFQK